MRQKIIFVSFSILLLLAFTTESIAQDIEKHTNQATSVNAGEQIDWQVISSGGVRGTSTDLVLSNTVGQSLVSMGTTTDYNYNGGYWQNFYADPQSCCIGIRGNVDGIGGEPGIDISDILFMVEWMFRLPGDAPEPPCLEEAEINGEEPTDISDLLYMVEYMFRLPGEAPAPVACM